ncbi:MAG TPA: hypothetical protein VLJ37_10720 [bacterium]|nr:hypothetical protein [bacterium]
MSRVFITDPKNPEGSPLAEAHFGEGFENGWAGPFSNDGEITNTERDHALAQLQDGINSQIHGEGGPLGLGGLGGINEVYLQPWRLDGVDRYDVPDGTTRRVTLHLEESYSRPAGFLFFQETATAVRDVEVTLRWEHGRVTIYPGTVPPYASTPPAAPGAPQPDPIGEAWDSMVSGVQNFFSNTAPHAMTSAWKSIASVFA